MKFKNIFVSLILVGFFTWACEDFQLYENVPVGNPKLIITDLTPASGPLRGDTLTIIGSGFNSIPYQNTVQFAKAARFQPYVNEKGEVTDSLIYVVTEYDNNPARVIDATPNTLKIIIPDAAVSGPILVAYGIDTVYSPIAFTLISTSKRPVLSSVRPQFGAPGTLVTVTGQVHFTDDMVASFGGTLVGFTRSQSTGFQFAVPSMFSGPTDLRVGSIVETGDTLWSTSLNFGVLPSPESVPFLVTSDLDDIVAKAEVVDEKIEITKFSLQNANSPQGITISADSSVIYWIDQTATASGQPICTILRGSVESGNASIEKVTYGAGVEISDLVIDGAFLYAATNKNIRRFTINPNGSWGNATAILNPAGAPDAKRTNLKIDGTNFYWVDQTNRKIYKGVLGSGANGTIAFPGEEIYTNLESPSALTINPANGDIYFTSITAEGSIIYKGNVNSKETPIEFYLEEDNTIGFKDLEIDLLNRYVYWSRAGFSNSANNGIYRKSYKTSLAKAELVFQFPYPLYFDFPF